MTRGIVADLLTDLHVMMGNAVNTGSPDVSGVVPVGAHIVFSMHDANECSRNDKCGRK